MKRSYLYLFLFIIFVGCKENKVKSIKTIEVKGRVLTCSNFDGATFIGVKDSTFIVEVIGGDFLFEIYKIRGNSLQKTKRFGSKGQGPNEFLFPVSYFDKKTSKLFVVDNYSVLGNGCIIDTKSEKIRDKTTWKSFDLKWMKTFYGGVSFIPKNDNELLFLGAFPKEKSLLSTISISNKTSKMIDFWIENPYITNNDRLNKSVYMQNAYIFKNTTNNKILYCGGTGKVVHLFGLNGENVNSLIKIYDEVSPNKPKDKINFVLTEDVNWDIFAKVTDDFIFLRPYKFDKKYSDYKGYPFYYSEVLETYDWNGKHLLNLKFDTPFYDFIIDENNEFVFTLTSDLTTDEIIVKKYKIKDLIQ